MLNLYVIFLQNINIRFTIAGGFGRRASDGGANLQMYFQRQHTDGGYSQPSSNEQIAQVFN